jgi:hypothetical protein
LIFSRKWLSSSSAVAVAVDLLGDLGGEWVGGLGEVGFDFGVGAVGVVVVLVDFAFGELFGVSDFLAVDLGAESLVIIFLAGVLARALALSFASEPDADADEILAGVLEGVLEAAVILFFGGGEVSLFLLRCKSRRL